MFPWLGRAWTINLRIETREIFSGSHHGQAMSLFLYFFHEIDLNFSNNYDELQHNRTVIIVSTISCGFKSFYQ